MKQGITKMVFGCLGNSKKKDRTEVFMEKHQAVRDLWVRIEDRGWGGYIGWVIRKEGFGR
jgi:hypothetical protein